MTSISARLASAILLTLLLTSCDEAPTAPLGGDAAIAPGADGNGVQDAPDISGPGGPNGIVEVTFTGLGSGAPSASAISAPTAATLERIRASTGVAGIGPATAGLAASHQSLTGTGTTTADAASTVEGNLVDGPARASRALEGISDSDGTIQLDPVSTGSFTMGTRGIDGMRYLYATFRVRNAQSDGAPYASSRQNLTFVTVDTDGTIGATPVSQLRRFDGSPITGATAIAIAESMLPTGQVGQGTSSEMISSGPDVLQVFEEAEVAADQVPWPTDVTDVFPYGFITRSSSSATSRTLAANPAANAYDGLVTFAYMLPLQSSAEEDPFSISIQVMTMDDSETRITQSIEEQAPAARAAFEARAAALGASITLLPGGQYAGGSAIRTINAVRTAGTAASPATFLVAPPVPDERTLTLSNAALTADGTSLATMTVALYNAAGDRITRVHHDLSLTVTAITQYTPGAAVSGIVDHGDGTYTAILTAPPNNGSGSVEVRVDGDTDVLDGDGVTYSGGNNVPSVPPGLPSPFCNYTDASHHYISCATVTHPTLFRFLEDSANDPVPLAGTDADGDPLTVRVVAIQNIHLATLEDEEGNPVAAGDATDSTIYVTPPPDAYGSWFASVSYVVSDGVGESNTGVAYVFIDGVNDPPRPTLASTLTMFEDGPDLQFLMGGHDIEGNIYGVRYTIRPDIRGGLYYISPGGDVLITPATTTVDGSSDISFGWPMKFVPDPNDWDVNEYVAFSYVLEEIPGGLTGPENDVVIKVLPVNDAPVTTIEGIGAAQNHDLAATVVQGGTYSLPDLAVNDAEIYPDQEAPRDVAYAVRIEASTDASITLDYWDFMDALVEFSGIGTPVITFSMPYDVTKQGFRLDLTLDKLLNSLQFTQETVGPATLTITIDDQGNAGSCTVGDVNDPPPPCAKTSVTTIAIDVQAGTPPAGETEMVLTQAGEE